MPAAPVRKSSFSALSATARAEAMVSALMLSSVPSSAAEGAGEMGGLGAAAVHEDDADAHLVQHVHLLDEGAGGGFALQGSAPRLEDEGLAPEDPDVRHGVLQGRGLGRLLSDVFHLCP